MNPKYDEIKTDIVDAKPRKTQAVERVLNRALTQVLFSARRNLTIIDLIISMSQETSSHAAYFMLKYGIEDRDDLIKYYGEHYNVKSGRRVANDKKATELLREYCTDLNEQAQELLDKKITNIVFIQIKRIIPIIRIEI